MGRIGKKLGWIALLLGIPVALQGQVVSVLDHTAQMDDLVSRGFVDVGSEGGSGSATSENTGNSAPGETSDPEKLGLTHTFWHRLQVHGTLSQGFIYGSGNNYLAVHTSDGSARWSEGAFNLSTAIRDNFHLGMQVHSYFMGELGRGTVQLDWAFADYRMKDWLGFRCGKVKAPLGLFNEVEDTDTLYNWALLPQSIYEAEFRSYNVPVVGGALYGRIKPGRSRITYQFYGGRRSVAANDGSQPLTWQLYGINQGATAGYTYGADLKWDTPIKGLAAGVSLDRSRVVAPHADWPVNPYGVPLVLRIDAAIRREIYSLHFQRGKLDLAAEGKHEPHAVSNNGVQVQPSPSPRNAWYVMGAYHFTNKLIGGSYFSRVVGTSFNDAFRWVYYDPSQPEFYSNDAVVNARYDINRFFYLKLEGHYVDGHLGAFFPATNLNGLQRITRLAIARFGFTF
jgi:hypothetical protein